MILSDKQQVDRLEEWVTSVPEPQSCPENVRMRLLNGNCREKTKELKDNSIAAVVKDPPYGISKEPDIGSGGFMGRRYHPDTEVLGPAGWHPIAEVQTDTAMYSRAATGSLTPATAIEVHHYDFDGDLIRVKGKVTDQLVTPNHNLWISTGGAQTWDLCRADELPDDFLVTNLVLTYGERPTVTQEPYKGPVHCVTLDRGHVLLTRLRGRTVWSGNS